MSRAPSDKTTIANLRREVKQLQADLRTWQETARQNRARATQAEQAVAEWKVRFDKLLEFRKTLEKQA